MKFLCLVILFFGIASSIPFDIKSRSEVILDDMVLTADQNEWLFPSSKPTSRNGLIDPTRRWENGKVYYWMDPRIPSDSMKLITNSLKKIEAVTCLKFIQGANPQGHYIRVKNDEAGCWSNVGYLGIVQKLNLGKGCFSEGKITHEFLHAVGFKHQQSSYERDQYVEIHLENVKEGHEHNFDKYSNNYITNFGTRYDYDSIMHYGPKSFSKNGLPTIVAKIPSEAKNMGQQKGLSQIDILKINRMYNC